MFDLIIFDCDGVLVDSERIANRVFAQILERECGLTFTEQQMFDTFVGCSAVRCMEILTDMLGHPPPAHLADQYRNQINHALAKSVEAVKGAETTLANLSAQAIRYCVASGGSHDKMQITLGRTGLLKYLDTKLYSSHDIKRSKPLPDIYLYAAEKMGNTPPNRCLVIEDSPIGVQAGVAAGMTVFGFAELMDGEKLKAAGAMHIFTDMGRLLEEIQGYLDRLVDRGL